MYRKQHKPRLGLGCAELLTLYAKVVTIYAVMETPRLGLGLDPFQHNMYIKQHKPGLGLGYAELLTHYAKVVTFYAVMDTSRLGLGCAELLFYILMTPK